MRNNLGMLQWLLGDYLPEPPQQAPAPQTQPPGMSGTGYGSGLAPWWTGHTDHFMGGMGPLGPEMTELDARKILHAIGQSYGQQGRNPGAQVPWGKGGNGGGYGGGPNPNVPPQDNTHAPIDTGMRSRGSGFGAAYNRRRGLLQPEE